MFFFATLLFLPFIFYTYIMRKIGLYNSLFIGIVMVALFFPPSAEARGSVQSGFCKVYQRDPDPTLQLVVYLNRQQRDGISLRFFSGGEVQELAWYQKDALQGQRRRFNSEGQIISSAQFSGGELNGILEEYGDQGQLLSRKRFLSGELHGLSEYYNRKGALERRVVYENGRAVHMEEF